MPGGLGLALIFCDRSALPCTMTTIIEGAGLSTISDSNFPRCSSRKIVRLFVDERCPRHNCGSEYEHGVQKDRSNQKKF